MYRRYCDDSCRNYNYGYPNYGRVGSTNYNRSSNRRYNDGSVDSSPYWNEYYYGPRRRTPYAWERDREIGDNLRRSRSRRSAGTEDVILAPRTADRVESQPAPKDQPAPKEGLNFEDKNRSNLLLFTFHYTLLDGIQKVLKDV